MEEKEKTYFGFKLVTLKEKENMVLNIFESIANKYDLMNNILSLGIHHIWKWLSVELSEIKPGQIVLDLAGGSGDITKLLSKKVGKYGRVILADISTSMLNVGISKLLDTGYLENITFIQANAEQLPFIDNSFHCIFIGFGFRNISDQNKALHSIYRVCKPGGKLLILDFSHPHHKILKFFYDWYSFNVIPKLGEIFCKDYNSYKYLVESIRMHKDQEQLKKMIELSNFDDCIYYNFSGGIVSLHIAYKY